MRQYDYDECERTEETTAVYRLGSQCDMRSGDMYPQRKHSIHLMWDTGWS